MANGQARWAGVLFEQVLSARWLLRRAGCEETLGWWPSLS
jgi:hypothetical protein